MREAALSRYREHPGLRAHLSAKTKALYRKGILKSPLATMGNGQALPPYEELARIFLEPLGFQSQYTVSSGRAGPPYTLDFGHPDLKLDVEIDGQQHAETRIQERDRQRDAHLASLGWRVIRIRNEPISAMLLEILARRLPE
jgi:very-short-patch-repair endonuclease